MKLFQSFGQVNSSKRARILAYVFEYTGAAQSVIVPDWANYIQADLAGAQGGREQNAGYGAYGGRVVATRNITGGDTLYVYVGGMGETDADRVYDGVPTGRLGGFNGGGNGGLDNSGANRTGGGGGGATDIRLNTDNLASRIIVAGGGGGGSVNAGGGVGGGLVGGSVSLDKYGNIYTVGGGTQSAGGAGCSGPAPFVSGNAGSLGQGGNAPTASSLYYANPTGGGGGGGYYGGGSGAHGTNNINGYYYYGNVGGGGGSSYTDGSCTNVTHTQGYDPYQEAVPRHGIAYITFYEREPS